MSLAAVSAVAPERDPVAAALNRLVDTGRAIDTAAAGRWALEMEAQCLGVPHLIARERPAVAPIADVVLTPGARILLGLDKPPTPPPPRATAADREQLRRQARWSLRDLFESAGDVACDLISEALPRVRST